MSDDITPGFYRIEGLGQDREGRMFVRVAQDLTVWGLSVYDADGEGPTAEYRTHGCRLSAAMVVWPREQWHADRDRRAEAQAEHDQRAAAIRLTVTPATLRRAETLGWTPGEGDVLLWALTEIERLLDAMEYDDFLRGFGRSPAGDRAPDPRGGPAEAGGARAGRVHEPMAGSAVMAPPATIAALYVDVKRGPYAHLPGVDCWGEARDATRYAGPWPVVAHPACGPWGRLRGQCTLQDPTHGPRGVEQVIRWGGVLEHPAGSLLWAYCHLPRPGEPSRYVDSGGVLRRLWSIEVDQCEWGHQARKRTWLLLVGVEPDAVPLPPYPGRQPTRTVQSRLHAWSGRPDRLQEMSKTQRHITPPEMAEALVAMARSVKQASGPAIL